MFSKYFSEIFKLSKNLKSISNSFSEILKLFATLPACTKPKSKVSSATNRYWHRFWHPWSLNLERNKLFRLSFLVENPCGPYARFSNWGILVVIHFQNCQLKKIDILFTKKYIKLYFRIFLEWNWRNQAAQGFFHMWENPCAAWTAVPPIPIWKM